MPEFVDDFKGRTGVLGNGWLDSSGELQIHVEGQAEFVYGGQPLYEGWTFAEPTGGAGWTLRGDSFPRGPWKGSRLVEDVNFSYELRDIEGGTVLGDRRGRTDVRVLVSNSPEPQLELYVAWEVDGVVHGAVQRSVEFNYVDLLSNTLPAVGDREVVLYTEVENLEPNRTASFSQPAIRKGSYTPDTLALTYQDNGSEYVISLVGASPYFGEIFVRNADGTLVYSTPYSENVAGTQVKARGIGYLLRSQYAEIVAYASATDSTVIDRSIFAIAAYAPTGVIRHVYEELPDAYPSGRTFRVVHTNPSSTIWFRYKTRKSEVINGPFSNSNGSPLPIFTNQDDELEWVEIATTNGGTAVGRADYVPLQSERKVIDRYRFPIQAVDYQRNDFFDGTGYAGVLREFAPISGKEWYAEVSGRCDSPPFQNWGNMVLVLAADSLDDDAATAFLYLSFDVGGYIGVWYRDGNGNDVLQGNTNTNGLEDNAFKSLVPYPDEKPTQTFTWRLSFDPVSGVVEVLVDGDLNGSVTLPPNERDRLVDLAGSDRKLYAGFGISPFIFEEVRGTWYATRFASTGPQDGSVELGGDRAVFIGPIY